MTLCIAMTACATRMPKEAIVVVEKIVPVPTALTKPCDEVKKQDDTFGEAVRLANARKASLAECNARMAEIRKLGEKP
jgi:hypothetical protein